MYPLQFPNRDLRGDIARLPDSQCLQRFRPLRTLTPDQRVEPVRANYDRDIGPPAQSPPDVRHHVPETVQVAWRERCRGTRTRVRMELHQGHVLVPRGLDRARERLVGQGDVETGLVVKVDGVKKLDAVHINPQTITVQIELPIAE